MSREPSIQLKKSHLFNECNRDKVYPYTDAQYVYYTQTGTDEEKTVQEVLDGLLAKPDPEDDPTPIDPSDVGLTEEQYNALKADLKRDIKQEILTEIRLMLSSVFLKQFWDAETANQISSSNLSGYAGCMMTFKGTHTTDETIDIPDFWLHKNAKISSSNGDTTINVTGGVNINGEVNAKGLYDTSEESNEQGQ